MDANPAGFQNCVFGELLSDLQVLKVGMPGDAGYKPLPPQGKSSECEFFPNHGSLHWLGFMARLFLSLSYAFSFARYVGIPQLVFSPTMKTVLYAAISSLCPQEEAGLESSHVTVFAGALCVVALCQQSPAQSRHFSAC